jgi:hypothetical protein
MTCGNVGSEVPVKRGDTVVLNFAITDEGVAADLTGISARFTVKRFIADADPGLVQKTIGAGITITDVLGGLLEVELEPADTDYADENLLWDLQITTAGGQNFTVAEGVLQFSQDVTLNV